MFNFKELKLDKREDPENTSSFVGIRRTKNNELEFRLPKGFENFPENDFNATKEFFFKMYRTFKKFENDKTRLPIDERPAGKDNIEKMGNAYRFKDKEDNEVLLYSKISVIENLLEAYRDLALDVIERRYGLDEKIDYSKIDQYLQKAVYLPGDVIYLDEMELPRYVLRYESTTIIDLFCFILTELETELEQESDERVKELSHRFKEQHLSHEQSLFNEETFDTTISILKDVLDDIDKITAYKDEDYWRLYEAIECFLYGELDMENTHEEGIFWGIKDFSSIWEDMCNTHAFATCDVVYADTNIIFNGKRVANCTFGGRKIFIEKNFVNPFFIKFRGDKRWMRPDALHRLNLIPNGSLFDECIKITILKRGEWIGKNKHKGHKLAIVNFKIELLDNEFTELYKEFCYELKGYADSCPQRSGVEIKGNFYFNFPEWALDETKSFLIEKYQEKPTSFKLMDWKYMDENDFKYKNLKLEKDITKQICYEFCLSRFSLMQNIFVIPFLFRNEVFGKIIESKLLYSRLQENKINVLKANFQLIQEVYLNHD
jgi:hypothetical protein